MSPSEATARPMIEPPKKATESAAAAPSACAAVVVRTLALVAVYMPNQPAPAEDRAPAMKAQTVSMPRPDTNNRTSSTAAKMASIVYSPAHEHHRTVMDGVGDLLDGRFAFVVAQDETIDDDRRYHPDNAQQGRQQGSVYHCYHCLFHVID